MKKLSSRPIKDGDFRAWDTLASQHGCLFDSIRWTSLFEPAIRRIGIFDAGGDLRGGFCVWEQRKFGLRILRNPPFTPHVGPFFEYRASNAAARTNEQRTVVGAMTNWLDKSGAALVSLGLSMEHTDCLPFYWHKFKVVPHYTFRISLHQPPEELLSAMSDDRRKGVRKAKKDGVDLQPIERTADIRCLVIDSLGRNDKRIPTAEMDKILETYPPGQGGYGFGASAQGQVQAGAYVVHDARTAFYLLGGYAEGAHHGAGALAMWNSILKAKELGLEVFDFEGSVIPPIERYFRGFGGRLTPYFSIHKAWLPLEMLLKLFYRNRF